MHGVREQGAELDQQLVADGVSEAVGVIPEPVEVEVEERETGVPLGLARRSSRFRWRAKSRRLTRRVSGSVAVIFSLWQWSWLHQSVCSLLLL